MVQLYYQRVHQKLIQEARALITKRTTLMFSQILVIIVEPTKESLMLTQLISIQVLKILSTILQVI